jgi:hypothetical protein
LYFIINHASIILHVACAAEQYTLLFPGSCFLLIPVAGRSFLMAGRRKKTQTSKPVAGCQQPVYLKNGPKPDELKERTCYALFAG